MTKNEIVEQVKALIAAGSCCPEAKEAGEKYLAAIGTEGEKEAAAVLIAELEEDITSIDDLIGLAESDMGKQIFGEEGAAQTAAAAKAAKAEGETVCICPACQASKVILAEKDVIL